MPNYSIPNLDKSKLKLEPYSEEAERAVLGGLMLDEMAWEKVVTELSNDDFYIEKHRQIFETMLTLAHKQMPMDVLHVAELLKRNNKFTSDEDFEFLADLSTSISSSVNITAYAHIVYERSVLRKLIHANKESTELAYNPENLTAEEVVDKAGQQIFALAQGRAKGGPLAVREIMLKTVKRVEYLFEQGDELSGLDTGFKDLNHKTGGLQNSDLIIVAGRPSMGKTTFALNIVEHVALHEGKNPNKTVLVFSLEMPGEQLGLKMLSSLAGIDQTRIRTGNLTDSDWAKITNTVSLISNRKLFIDDTSDISPLEMRARARRLVREHGDLSLIMVDYLQLMKIPGFNHDNRTGEISEISRMLKSMAREFNCPVVALSQLNRSVEGRADKRPLNADLRESGAIEQDADVIMFVYRDEFYHPEKADNKGIAEIIIGKQRNGPTGMLKLGFQGNLSKFTDLANASYSEIADSPSYNPNYTPNSSYNANNGMQNYAGDADNVIPYGVV